MSVLKISGGKSLSGRVDVAGSKNTALAILSSVILADGESTLLNVPTVSDTLIKSQLLERFGVKVEWTKDGLKVDSSSLVDGEADEQIVRAIRTSFYLLGPMLARVGRVTMPAPGGCQIGARPVDFHVKGLTKLGAHITLEGGVYHAYADKLRGADIYLDFPSAGATQHLMATATMAEGVTVVQNAACEPEVVYLADFLNRMGGRVEGAGTSTITVSGVKTLKPCTYRIPSDRLQAGTYLLAGAISGGDVTVQGVLPEHQAALLNKMREAGVDVDEGYDWVRVRAPRRINGIRVKTMPYPGFPTDIQQPMAALLSLAEGTSVIEETIYESRIGHVQELNRMGAKIQMERSAAIIEGVEKLQGATVVASDLRAGAALCLAALAAEGESTIKNADLVDRGYPDFEGTLLALGADVRRVRGGVESEERF